MFEAHYFTDVLIFLFAAVLVAAVSSRLKSSPVLGYLVAGILVGPWGMQLMRNIEGTKNVSELGLIFLFFAIGLGLPLHRLKTLRRYLFGLGGVQTVVTCVVLTVIAHFCGLSPRTAFVVGASLSLSSTAVVLQLLSEANELSAKHGRISFSVLLFQDLAAILLLIIVEFMKPDSDADTSIYLVMVDFTKSIGGVLAVVLLGRFVIKPLYRLLDRSSDQPDLFIAYTLLVILGVSTLSKRLGVSLEFAAFLTGIILADSEFRQKVEGVIRSFRGLLLGLFFMGIGMAINIKVMWEYLGTIALVLVAVIPIKFAIVYVATRMFNEGNWPALRTSVLLAPCGEFAFVLLVPAISHKLVPQSVGQVMIMTAALSMMITPFMAQIVSRYAPSEEEDDEAEVVKSGT